tara:strand:- start:105 stop:569 length:465 start_codon:yes stop_codon:yes gene_type:complete
MKTLCLDNKGILEYQKNRFPYLMIDVAEEILPGKSAKGFKNLSSNEWFFKCHFPGDPNMPGMLQIESMVQMSALIILTLPNNKGKIMYISKLKKAIFKKKVLIGDKFLIITNLKSFKRGIASFVAKAFVRESKVSEAEFDLVLPQELNKYKLRS